MKKDTIYYVKKLFNYAYSEGYTLTSALGKIESTLYLVGTV
jgi:hypothetical protein